MATGSDTCVKEEFAKPSPQVIGPPEWVDHASVYKLYRGTTGKIKGQSSRIWTNFPLLELCWAGYDQPASSKERISLLEITQCQWETFVDDDDANSYRVNVYGGATSSTSSPQDHIDSTTPGRLSSEGSLPFISVVSPAPALQEFADALQQLLSSREREGSKGLEFIQRSLFQYLWKHQRLGRSETELYEAQSVLAFNLDPRDGIEYLGKQLGKKTSEEVGKWLAKMSTQKGGLDPTMLGSYFSRKETLEAFNAFVHSLDFGCDDIVAALRRLFDSLKPAGESQVINRILESFAEAYFLQWKAQKDLSEPKTSWTNGDSVYQVAMSLIMLNTELHVCTKKVPTNTKKPLMTAEGYVELARTVVGPEQAPEEALRAWFEAVRETEISMAPLPRAAFSELPVQPAMEGWLIAVFGVQMRQRFWAVLALQRMYLFSDVSEVEQWDAIDLKDASVCSIAEDDASKDRFSVDLQGKKNCRSLWLCFVKGTRAEYLEEEVRAFEVYQPAPEKPSILQKLSKPRSRLALVAETPELMQKWVSLISCGPT